LTNLPLEKVYLQVVMMTLIFSIVVVYPVMLYPAFKIFEFHFFKKIFQQNIFRTVVALSTIGIGIGSIGNFDSLLAIVGSVLCTPLAVIFPALFHWILFKETQSVKRSFLDIIVFMLGCSISVIVFTFTITTGFKH
jgi:proton-coupled amino acid transporter